MQLKLTGGAAALVFGSLMVLPSWAEIKVVPDVVKPAVDDKQRSLEPDQVKLTGLLGERIAAGEKNRLLTIDEDLLLDGFRKRPGEHPWIGEHVGKWLHAATLTWVHTGDPLLREKLDRVAAGLVETQMPDGYLGTYVEKDRWTSWDVWVHKYDLIGLLTYYRYTGQKPALEASKKVGDLLCNTFGQGQRDIIKAGEHVGMAATSVLEPMVVLYRATGDKKYLEFCRYILWSWDQPHGPKVLSTLAAGKGVNQVANGKAYEMLSNLVGLCELYRTTGEEQLLPPVIHAWDDIVTNRLYISGSSSQGELFRGDGFLPNDEKPHIMETCVTVTWMQLNAQLLRLTGDARYADQLERTAYNQLLFAQKQDGGDFCYYNPLEGKRAWKPLGKRDIHCCLSSGPRGLALIPTFVYGVDSGGIVVNLYESGSARVTLADGRKGSILQQAAYPAEGKSEIKVTCEGAGQLAVRVRAPSWCRETHASGNGAKVTGRSDPEKSLQSQGAAYLTLLQSAAGGKAIAVEMPMPIRLIDGQGTNKGKVAVMRGPLVLAAEETLNASLKPLTGTSIRADSAGRVNAGATLKDCTCTVDACTGEGGHTPAELRMAPLAFAGIDNVWYQVWFTKAEPGCGK